MEHLWGFRRSISLSTPLIIHFLLTLSWKKKFFYLSLRMVNRISEPSKLTLSEIHNSMEISAIICYWSTFMKKTLKSNRNYLRFLEQQKKKSMRKRNAIFYIIGRPSLKKKLTRRRQMWPLGCSILFFFWQRNNSH